MPVLRPEWLLYPQWILVLWAPLAGYLMWRTAMRSARLGGPRTRFWFTFFMSLLPLVVWLVPYLPDSSLRHLPYMAPIAWGVWQAPPEVLDAFRSSIAGRWLPVRWLLFNAPLFAPAVGGLVALLWGGAEYLRVAAAIRRLPRYERDGVTILRTGGWMAFTFGLLRPRVFMTEAVWQSPHRRAVLAHEQAHVRSRHPLLLFVARIVRRGAWYVPFWHRVVTQLEFEAERLCDDNACREVGRAPVARALLAALEAATRESPDLSGDANAPARSRPAPQVPAWLPSFAGRGPGVGVEHRGHAAAGAASRGSGSAQTGLLGRVQALAEEGPARASRLLLWGIAGGYAAIVILL